LGTLPLVGRFFSYKQTILDQNETIIFVTVGLANPASIDMETGLPQNTRLAQRYTIRETADMRVAQAEDRLLQTQENIQMRKELQDLKAANQKLIDQQKAKKPASKQEAPVEEPTDVLEPAVDVSSMGEDVTGEEIVPVEPGADISSSSSADVSPVALAEGEVAVKEEALAKKEASAKAEPVAEEAPPVDAPVEPLIEEESGGGVYDVKSTETE